MRGYSSQAVAIEVPLCDGETRRICGVRCVWIVAANGACFAGEEDGLRVSAIEARGGRWFVTLTSAKLTFSAYVADLYDVAVSS